jgi:choline-sulfatase
MHDACARIPLLARLPGRFAAGQVCDMPANLVDIAPTVCAAAGTRIDSHALDGCDLADLATGATQRELVFSQHAFVPFKPKGHLLHQDPESRAALSTHMAVSRRWKYVYSAPDHREFLFDRRTDPLETRNRAGVVLCQKELAAMRGALLDHLRAGGETGGITPEGHWREFPRQVLPEDPDALLLIQDHAWPDTRIPGYTD